MENNIYKWNSDNINTFLELQDRRKRGFSINTTKVTELFNYIFDKALTPTSCGSCIKSRLNALQEDYNRFLDNISKEENNAPQTKIKRGRPKKSE